MKRLILTETSTVTIPNQDLADTQNKEEDLTAMMKKWTLKTILREYHQEEEVDQEVQEVCQVIEEAEEDMQGLVRVAVQELNGQLTYLMMKLQITTLNSNIRILFSK